MVFPAADLLERGGGLRWSLTTSNANLSHANLSGAFLKDADLSGAKLTGTKLAGADLSDAKLNGAHPPSTVKRLLPRTVPKP